MSDKDLLERLARRLFKEFHGYAKVWPIEWPEIADESKEPWLKAADALLSELSAAGYAVVPKAWLVGSGMTEEERLKQSWDEIERLDRLADTKGEGHG